MSGDKLLLEKRGHVLLMGLNRPDKLNAFDLEMFFDLSRAYFELDRNPELHCGLLYAQGNQFTAGVDLPQWAPYFARGEFPRLPEKCLDPLGLDEDQRVSKPMVVAVRGICYTIGLELLLATDIRVAGNDARFGQIEVKRGIHAVGGATIRLPQEIGWGNAMRCLLTADEMPAAEAHRLGLIQELRPSDEVFDAALGIARTIAKQAPLAVKATLKSARTARAQGHHAARERLLPAMQKLMSTQDAQEGMQSFMERREPRFKGS